MVEVARPTTHTENQRISENPITYTPLLGLQGRLALGGTALFPSTPVELTQGINKENEPATMTLLDKASKRERKNHWASQPEQSKDAQLTQWKNSVVAKINLIPSSTLGQNHADFFTHLGIDPAHFNESNAQDLYDKYFSKNVSGSGIENFASDVVQAYASEGANGIANLKNHLAAIKWMAEMFRGNSAEIVTQLIDTRIDNQSPDAFVAARKDKVNNLSDNEKELLTFLTEGETAPTEPPETHTVTTEDEAQHQPVVDSGPPLVLSPNETVSDPEVEDKRITQAYGEKVQGASHIRKGLPCQDAIRVESDPENGIFSLAVADGHGSERHVRSEKGAQFAADVLNGQFAEIRRIMQEKGPEEAEKYIQDQLPKQISESWNARVFEDIKANPFSLEEQSLAQLTSASQETLLPYGSTLLGAMVVGNKLVLVQIGDGNIFITDAQGMTSPIPHDPAMLGNETFSLCQKDAIDYINIISVDASSFINPMIVVATDGLSNSYTDDSSFHQLMTDLYPMSDDTIKSNLTTWLNEISKKGSGDDVALGVLRIKNAPPRPQS